MSAEPAQLFGAPGDRCANCQAPLAVDQRYCVHCGTRRGKTRFSLAAVAAQAAPPPPPPPEPKRTARSRLPAGVTLVTGVATLLLAMGVGVLIGHDSTSSAPQRASSPLIITGPAATPTTTTAASTSTGKSGAGGSTYSTKQSSQIQKQIGVKPTTVKVTAQSKQQASQAATKVFGHNSKLVKNPTVQPGQSCTGGAGCQNGKFTGNFFP